MELQKCGRLFVSCAMPNMGQYLFIVCSDVLTQNLNFSDAQGKTILISSHILSEIALLADDIGIIDHGVLLEEESLTELENKNRHYIQLP